MDVTDASWRKSSRSSGNGGECVEVAAQAESVVAVRDSKNPTGPVLAFPASQWRTFTHQVKKGALDLR
ncbi:MAG TPA: DUF397 domain-containing protein [Streptosporangiaceae bacterium]